MPFLIYELVVNKEARDNAWTNCFWSVGSQWLVTLGATFNALSLKYGTGAIVLGVENVKFCEQVILEMALTGFKKIPNAFQLGGLVSGLLGGIIIIAESNKST